MPSNLNLPGLIVGVLYLGLVWGIIWWMFAARPARERNRTARSRIHRNCIIVPLTEPGTCRQALEFACSLASERHAKLILAHVIEIPMTLGLDVPLEEAEERGRAILENGESMVKEFGLPAESRLIRHRLTANAILELAQKTGAETIVLGAGTPPWWSLSRIEWNVAELMRRAPCQVVVTKAAITA